MSRPPLVLGLRTWLLASYLVVFLLPGVAFVGTGALRSDLHRQTEEDLAHQAELVALAARGRLADREPLTTMLVEARSRTLAGFRIVDAEGRILASSGGDAGENIRDNVEVAAALRGERSWMTRPRDNSRSLSQPLTSVSRRADVRIFYAAPIEEEGRVVGAVAVSRTPREEVQALYQMWPRLGLGLAATAGMTVGVALLAGYYASRSLRALAEVSERIGAGDLPRAEEVEEAAGSRIAEARALARAMLAMAERLRARLTYISEFAGNVSHEFKTPVSSLRGTVELLKDDPEMPPEQRTRFLDNALADLDRLSRLVGGLLRLARAEEGGQRAPLDLGALAREVGARFEVPVEGEAGEVLANREQLDAVFANLLENARRHGGAGVRLRLAPGEVEVVDDGPGITAANLPKVFDRFFTTDRARGGTGLGLALVRAVVEAHGGEVDVRSRPGETIFRVRLPRR